MVCLLYDYIEMITPLDDCLLFAAVCMIPGEIH